MKTLRIGSVADVPHLENGQWKFLVSICREEATQWRDDELDLIREITSRLYIRLERSRVEEALKKNEERFRRVVDSRPVGVLFANMEGVITQANSTLLDMLGCTPEWLVGKHWSVLTPREYKARDGEATKELVSTGSVQPYEKEYIRRDGSRLY